MTASGPDRAGADGWTLTPNLVGTIGAGVLLAVIGAATGRPDVALLGVPLVLGGTRALPRRPAAQPDTTQPDAAQPDAAQPDARVGARLEEVVTSGAEGVLAARVVLTAPAGAAAVRLRLSRPGHRHVEALVDVHGGQRTLTAAARTVRTGGQPLFTVEHQAVAPELVGPVGHATGAVHVLPTTRPVAALPLPGRLRGLTGQHPSRRPGDGGELRDVHPFQPGDAPRRVDWKVTARRSPALDQLYVRRTTALGEAVVTVVVDSRDDVGPDPATWSGRRAVRADDATSLDLARQAAATLAAGYLAGGDRVGIEDLGVRRHAVRSGAGRRQLDRVLQQLAWLRPEGDPPTRVRPPRIAAGAFVYVLSTFLDPEAAGMARGWLRTGHPVVAVDVLPRLRTRGLDERHGLALRLVLLERRDRLAELAAAGVEVVRWVDEPGTTSRLQLLARPSARRRPGGRPGSGAA